MSVCLFVATEVYVHMYVCLLLQRCTYICMYVCLLLQRCTYIYYVCLSVATEVYIYMYVCLSVATEVYIHMSVCLLLQRCTYICLFVCCYRGVHTYVCLFVCCYRGVHTYVCLFVCCYRGVHTYICLFVCCYRGATIEKCVELLTSEPSKLWGGFSLVVGPSGRDASGPSLNASKDQVLQFFLTTFKSFVHPLIFIRLLLHRLSLSDQENQTNLFDWSGKSPTSGSLSPTSHLVSVPPIETSVLESDWSMAGALSGRLHDIFAPSRGDRQGRDAAEVSTWAVHSSYTSDKVGGVRHTPFLC